MELDKQSVDVRFEQGGDAVTEFWSGFRRLHLGSILVALVLVAGVGVEPALASARPHAKHLSQSNVTFLETCPTECEAIYIAQARHYYAQQGLTVSLLPVPSGSAATVAALVGGAGQFADIDISTAALAVQQGAPLVNLMMTGYAPWQEIVINTTTAAAAGIPTTGSTTAQIQRQILALKGSHITLGVSNTASIAYNYAVAVLLHAGITVGAGSDVNFLSTGTPTNLVPALNSGQVQGFVNAPPTTVIPNVITIPIYKLAPVISAPWLGILATSAFVSAHPDTAQAMVNALALAWTWMGAHPNGARTASTPMYVANGISSPEEIDYLNAGFVQHNGSSIITTKQGYTSVTTALSLSHPTTPITVPFSAWITNKYANRAISLLHLKIAKG